ncbi:zinc finger and BTB domain-containing protein 49 isoform X11 [Pogona vitticeps]|uniref:Zinc finger and BTB domain-containing protein 49 isoform X6 n=1 Tax=Pogona vitticeps TaxID=103695 RepID=A0ABM5GHJ4_9SAUR
MTAERPGPLFASAFWLLRHSNMDAFASHSCYLLQQLHDQRIQGLLCDCMLVVKSVCFKAHKNVLAAFSQYFRSLFQNSPSQKNDVFHLDIKNVGGIGQILDYMYTSHLDLNQDNVRSHLSVIFVGNVSHRQEIFRLIYVDILVKNLTSVKSVGKDLQHLGMSSATLLSTLEKNHIYVIFVVEENASQDLVTYEDTSKLILGKNPITVRLVINVSAVLLSCVDTERYTVKSAMKVEIH